MPTELCPKCNKPYKPYSCSVKRCACSIEFLEGTFDVPPGEEFIVYTDDDCELHCPPYSFRAYAKECSFGSGQSAD